ncbi:MAG: penicillin-binding transpeptidase domain-containing protein, partial [Pyramidobacter sp.]
MRRGYRKAQWVLFFALMAFYLVTLVRVHLYPDPRATEQLMKQYRQSQRSAMDRETIYDCNGEPLALSVTTYSVYMDPGMEGFDPSSVDKLEPYVGKAKVKALKERLDRRFNWVRRYLSREEAEKILEACGKNRGYYIREERKRVYPKGSMLSHLLGYCDQDGWGLAGVELSWNSTLLLPEKRRISYRGALQVEVDSGRQDDSARKGLFLTIDSDIQYAMERFLSARADELHVPWAAGVCIESKTGEVKAMASYPTFDSNDRTTFSKIEALNNNAINRVYEPGSTFKPIMVAMALE